MASQTNGPLIVNSPREEPPRLRPEDEALLIAGAALDAVCASLEIPASDS